MDTRILDDIIEITVPIARMGKDQTAEIPGAVREQGRPGSFTLAQQRLAHTVQIAVTTRHQFLRSRNKSLLPAA
jgi:hypothetical protein